MAFAFASRGHRRRRALDAAPDGARAPATLRLPGDRPRSREPGAAPGGRPRSACPTTPSRPSTSRGSSACCARRVPTSSTCSAASAPSPGRSPRRLAGVALRRGRRALRGQPLERPAGAPPRPRPRHGLRRQLGVRRPQPARDRRRASLRCGSCRTASSGRSPAAPARARDAGRPPCCASGNITPNKGQGVLLEAIRLLRDRSPGDPRHARRARTSRTAASSARPRRGAWATPTPPSASSTTCAPTWPAPTLVVLPTLHREGMPTSLLEAMRAGVPVVASRVGGVAEIVEHGRTGILVTPGDAQGLAYADRRPARATTASPARLADAARSYVLERHGVPAMVEGHQAALARAPSAAAPGPDAPAPPPVAPRDDGGALAALPAPDPAGRDARRAGTGSPASPLRARTCQRSRRAGSRTGRCR